MDEVKKWVNMYSIIFPDDETAPSPYYDPADCIDPALLTECYSRFLERHRHHIKSQIDGLCTEAGVSESYPGRFMELVEGFLPQSRGTEDEVQTATVTAHSSKKGDPLPRSLNTESPPRLNQPFSQLDTTNLDNMLSQPDMPTAIGDSPDRNDHHPESMSTENLPRLVQDSPQRAATNLDNKFLLFMGGMESSVIDELGGNESLFLNDDPFLSPEDN
ncbi:hypothetical protein F4678DRAFT_465812 [Xylaria arbuscula]|nr:hypothetical protein F4678DRAFT_465812 [Xylaria arbuscula]